MCGACQSPAPAQRQGPTLSSKANATPDNSDLQDEQSVAVLRQRTSGEITNLKRAISSMYSSQFLRVFRSSAPTCHEDHTVRYTCRNAAVAPVGLVAQQHESELPFINGTQCAAVGTAQGHCGQDRPGLRPCLSVAATRPACAPTTVLEGPQRLGARRCVCVVRASSSRRGRACAHASAGAWVT